ncbi:phage tail assembly chaperone [Paenibacillus agricola]|uniref:Uncharacterized protein n=1 Tax=Paenibacillus agricola TaxID=2716264 RepID=A0ABX0JE59_9BACL|nr:hypothetical protein [Paenibacillus agricola]NHN33544.1 hypothetical protein [Paenibacillus agricola]
MQPTVNFKDVVVSGRTFRVKKFGARTGAFMAIKISKLLAPIVKQIDLGKLKKAEDVAGVDISAFNLSGIMESLGSLSEADFDYLHDTCLKAAGEMLPVGFTPVLNANGSYGVIGIEEDTMTVLALIAHVLMFNVSGFFQGGPLASLVGGLLTTSPQS